jgi:hypothetical protein
MIFKNIFAEKFSEKYWRFLLKLVIVFFQKFDNNIVFFGKTPFFSPKIGKKRKNSDHNIDPKSGH